MLAVQVLDMNLNCLECDDTLKKERGCQGNSRYPYYIGHDIYTKCPVKIITDITWEYISAYKFYKKNMLPNGMSYRNESQKYIDAMSILDAEVNELENSKNKVKNGRTRT